MSYFAVVVIPAFLSQRLGQSFDAQRMFRLSSGFSTQPVYISVEEWAEKPPNRTKYSGLSELIKN